MQRSADAADLMARLHGRGGVGEVGVGKNWLELAAYRAAHQV